MNKLIAALNGTGYPFAHYSWASAPEGTYGVYAEDSAISLWGDDKMQAQLISGTVDLFTRDDSGMPLEVVQAALCSAGVSWYLNTIQFEEDTGLIHYEWVFEVV